MDFKEINQLWRLADPLTVEQAATLIAGFDPTAVDASGMYFRNPETGLNDSDGISWVQTALAALVNAINDRKLRAGSNLSRPNTAAAGIRRQPLLRNSEAVTKGNPMLLAVARSG